MKRRCGSNLASVLSIASPIKGAAPKLDRLGIDERPSSKRSQSQLRIWNDASLRFLRRITEFVVGRAEMDHTGGRRCRAGLPRRYFLRRALWVRRALWIRFPGPPVHSRVGDRNDDFGRQNACQRRVAGRSAHLCDDIRRGEQRAGYDGMASATPKSRSSRYRLRSVLGEHSTILATEKDAYRCLVGEPDPSAAQGPKVRRLFAGASRIRTRGPIRAVP